jgi:CDP-diacylglycerol--serine O-phosphatidyltransferase
MLPSAVTLGNLCCGFISIIFVYKGQFLTGAWLILLAMIFDIMDGRVARLTKATSRFGEELDSLADLVSFGVAPAFLYYVLFLQKAGTPGLILAVIFVLAGCLRLARFNVQDSGDNFTGLPIPGGAAILASTVIFFSEYALVFPQGVYSAVTGITAALMMSNFEYPTFKKGDKKYFIHKLGIALSLVISLIIKPRFMFLIISGTYSALGPVISIKNFFLRMTFVNVCEVKYNNIKAKRKEKKEKNTNYQSENKDIDKDNDKDNDKDTKK